MTRDEIIETYRRRIAQGKRLRLSKAELDELIAGFLANLAQKNTEKDIKSLCETEIKLLEEGYPQTTLATKYLARYRKAIERAVSENTLTLTSSNSHQYQHHPRVTGIPETRTEHWGLTHLKYSPEIYETLDKRQSQINRTKQLSLRIVQLQRYLQTLQAFLDKQSEHESRRLAIAIAGFTGRRIGEVIARGTFTLTDHPYLLHFEGQQKKERAGYSIITLIPAADLLTQIERFRQLPDIQQITQLTGEALKSAINQFDVQVNRQCDRHFGQTGIIPTLEGKKNVTVHNLRSLWGAIAAHLFCPEHYHEYAFLQHYLGHVLDSGATGSYFRYQLADTQGHLLRDKGVLLNQIGALPLIQEIEDDTLAEQPVAEQASFPIIDISPQASAIMTEPQPNRPAAKTDPALENAPLTQRDLRQLRIEWQHNLSEQIIALRSDLETQLAKIRQTSNADEWMSRIEELEQENIKLRLEHDKAIAAHQAFAHLQTENAALTQKLNQAQDKLDRFRQLLNGNDTTEIESHPEALEPTPIDPEQRNQARPSNPIQESNPTQKSKNNLAINPDTDPASIVDSTQPRLLPRGPHSGKAFQRAEAIVLAIKDWNRLYPSESFAINAGVLETIFRVHRQAVKAFFEAYQNELWDYHQEIGVESPRWHNRGKDTQKLKAFVTQSLEG
jgi:Telomere resolvase